MTLTRNFRVDAFIGGLAIKAPCHAHSIVNLTLEGEQTVNGIAVTENDRVLVMNQDSAIENGIWVVETSAWGRAGDFDGNRDVVGGTLVPSYDGAKLIVHVVDGVPDSLRPGIDSFTFTLFFDAEYVETNIEMNGNTINNTVIDNSTIENTTINNIEMVNVNIKDQVLTSTSGVVVWDYEDGQSAFLDLTENVTTLTINNWPATGLGEIELEVTQDAASAYTIAWPAASDFVGGTGPDLTTLSSRHLIHLRTRDAGTRILVTHAAEFS